MNKKRFIGLIIASFTVLFTSSFVFANTMNDETNAAIFYRKAGSMLTKLPGVFHEKAAEIINNGWIGKNEELKEILKKNQGAINEFKKATKLTNCDFTFGKSIKKTVAAKTPRYINEHYLARLVIVEGRLYEKENRWDLALDNYLAVLRFANHMGQQKDFIIITTAVGIGAQRMVYIPLTQYINREKLSSQDCQTLLNSLVSLRNNRTGLDSAFEEEKEIMKKAIRIVVDEAKQKGQYDEIYLQKLCRKFDRLCNKFFEYDIIAFKENKPEIYEEKIIQLRNEVEKKIKPLNLTWESLKKVAGIPEGIDSPSLAAKILVSMAMPRYNPITRYYTSLSELNILITAGAMKLYKLKNDKIPDSLQELIPIYLSKLPEDPFNDFKPLKYEKRNKGWVVYSFGPDKQDNHGSFKYNAVSPDKTGDIVFSSFRGK